MPLCRPLLQLFRVAAFPLRQLAVEAREEYEQLLKDYELDMMVTEVERKALKVSLETKAKAVASGKAPRADLDLLRAELEGVKDPPEPKEVRYETNDATQEKIGEILAANPNGLLNSRDELMG